MGRPDKGSLSVYQYRLVEIGKDLEPVARNVVKLRIEYLSHSVHISYPQIPKFILRY